MLSALQKNFGLRGLILDLRNNPGGLLREGRRIANFFVDKGNVIVSVRGGTGDSVYHSTEATVAPALPLVVLTNNVTASSAEVLCGALQDNDRAVIMGQKTFGKGLVGEAFKLGGGAEAVITTAFYYTPSGRCIQSKNYWEEGIGFGSDSVGRRFVTGHGREVKATEGIMPDIEVPVKAEPPVLACLRDGNYVFKYVMQYAAKNEQPGMLSESDYADFVKSLPGSGCGYITSTEEKMKELKAAAEKEGMPSRSDRLAY